MKLSAISGNLSLFAGISAVRRYPLIPIVILIVVLVIPAAFANILSPYDPVKGDLKERLIPPFWVGDKLETIYIVSEIDVSDYRVQILDTDAQKLVSKGHARIIGGGDTMIQKHEVEKVGDLYRSRFGESQPVIETNWETAELIKYMSNCFFTTKISYMNEMYQIANKCEADWEVVLDGFFRDGRVGHSHMNVPGPDGKFGFGGSCFPKDIQAIIHFGESLGLNMSTLKGVWKTNLEVRPERDWEDLKGRAVVDETD